MFKYLILAFAGLVVVASGCTAEKEPATYGEARAAMANDPKYKWVTSPGVTISVFKEIELGKPYMTVLYENFGVDTIEHIRYELQTITRGANNAIRYDTLMKQIDPPKLLRPKDRHSVPRYIGEDTVTWDEAHVGQVWVVKNR